MAATGLQLNWESIEFASTTYTKVTGEQNNHGGNLVTFAGDMNVYPIAAAAGLHKPAFSFTLGDVGAAEALEVGTSGTLVATLADMKGATLGAVVYTAANAVVSDIQTGGQHAQVGTATVTLELISSDGTTPPVVISRA